MCGICGIISYKKPINPLEIRRMNHALIHRGPDGEGYYFDENLGLGMRRLSIIDLQGGGQPLYNEDKSIVLVLNGEIYNYKELQSILVGKGHKLSTCSDAETVVHLYEEYGIDCIHELRGMFAFALYDIRNGQLYIVRDRMGEKPLYICQTMDSLYFSSEFRSLLSSGVIEKQLDPFAIDLYFHFQYIPEPYSIIKGIRKLKAGHYLKINLKNQHIEEFCYWKMEEAPQLEGDPKILIRQQLEELSQMVIRADVPVGVALSGGIDSGIIAAFASKFYKGNLHAFTVGYEGRPESDERSDAEKIARHLGLPFHEIEISNNDIINNFSKVCGHTDDPIADISGFGYYSVSKAAHDNNIPVLLQGQGGDELFWGYKWVRDNYKYVILKDQLLNKKISFTNYYCQKFNEIRSSSPIKRFAKGILSYSNAIQLYNRHKNEDGNIFPFYDFLPDFNFNYSDCYGDFLIGSQAALDKFAPFRVERPWKNPEITLTRLIAQTYLLENGIAQGDRLSMANSVELRLPLLDYKFVETVIGVRKKLNDIDLSPKHFLKEIGKDLLPDWVFTNRKRGFEPPVRIWLDIIDTTYKHVLADGLLVSNGIISKNAGEQMAQQAKNNLNPGSVFFKSIVMEFYLQSLFSS